MWTAVVVTCPHASWCGPLEAEVRTIVGLGIGGCDGLEAGDTVLVVPDPGDDDTRVGSGGATLNALLVVTEHLSARHGYTTICPELLLSARILIVHIGPAILPFPTGLLYVPECLLDTGLPTTNLQHTIRLATSLAANSDPGVVVASSEILLAGRVDLDPRWRLSGDLQLLTVPAPSSYAIRHGVAVSDDEGTVVNVLYQPSMEDLCRLGQGEGADILAGMVWFSPAVAESLLKLNCMSPVDGCTYMGADSGEDSLQMSLYYDILPAAAKGVTMTEFMAGRCGKTLSRGRSSSPSMGAARRQVWLELRRYEMKVGRMKGLRHQYLGIVGRLGETELVTGWEKAKEFSHGMANTLNKSEGCLIMDSVLRGVDKTCTRRGVLMGAGMDDDAAGDDVLAPCDVAELSYPLVNRQTIKITIGLEDDLYLNYCNNGARFLGEPWHVQLERLGLDPESVWLEDQRKCLYNARVFPVGDSGRLMSMREAGKELDLSRGLHWRRSVRARAVCDIVRESGEVPAGCKYLQLFSLAVTEDWGRDLLDSLDEAALRLVDGVHGPERTGRLARLLATTADLLGCMANNNGGLRSGPAQNKAFSAGFGLLEEGKLREGLVEMAGARAGWMGHPARIVRTARHYEGAVQLLVRQTVMSAGRQVKVEVGGKERPQVGVAVVAACPARLDLSGGWTDTPPICYELGGRVVDLAITVDGKKPIGCKVTRTQSLHVSIFLGSGETLVIEKLEQMADYCNPTAPAALIKCCLLAAGLVNTKPGSDSLADQLAGGCGGGLQVEVWSDLPQGSGLGTSSILAGAVMAALWEAGGAVYSRRDLVHAVLVVEQLLTTGGGWQDQVGGLHPGINLGSSPASSEVKVEVEPLAENKEFLTRLESRLLLLYTGKPRLAKNLLQNVVRNWYSRDEEIVKCFKDNYDLAGECWKAANEGDIEGVGGCLSRYWGIKRTLAPGSEPEMVREVLDVLGPMSVGAGLAGAGGGGFLVAILNEGVDRREAMRLVRKINGTDRLTFHEAGVDMEGITVTVDGENVAVPF